LFTRDVTGVGLRELVETDAQETLRFFAREVHTEDLDQRPWFQRWPIAAFRLFEATAYRLSPARRILFAAAVPLLFAAWLEYFIHGVARGWSYAPGSLLMLGCSSLLFLLLVLELRDKLTLKGDLEVARQIQFGLLPFEPFSQGRLSARASMRPANTVGGDYFDIIDLGDDHTAIVVGDVAGKGMPAALLMALLQGSLRTLVTAGLRGVPLITRLNEHLFANIPANRLITLFYAEVSTRGGPLRYVNAGHNPPILLRTDGACETLGATGIALGILGEAGYEMLEVPFGPGDRLVLYTDGITEASNPADEEFGEERLMAAVVTRRAAATEAFVSGILADVHGFCAGVRPRDDQTLLVLDSGA
jgi:serine phosphatase RsbU (regulator of sigma subunit)